ncbi:MAG TPA: hypothetical protein VJV22_02475 [Acidobacteriaceae bacterium]|nr:hypothetical protein [Acidobacteriaceae bacterium]
MKHLRTPKFIAALAAAALPLSLSAATISGTAIDKTTNKPAAGDTAVLLDLAQGMNESARTTIDKQGHFLFTVPDSSTPHLVRIEHQKAEYYGSVPPNQTTVSIDVYDAAPKVSGIHIYADVSRIETNQTGLSVTESFFIRNESKPPMTQFGPKAFDFYLPSGSVLEGATATSTGGMAVSSQPVPLGDKDHYAFIFPVRPGETRFQVGYHLPYNGSAALHAKESLPTDNVAIMLPKSMTFSGSGFQPLHDEQGEPGINTWLVTNVSPDKPVDFSVSGTGAMPREQQAQGQGQPGQGMGGEQGGGEQAAQPNRPGGGLGNPIDTPDPLNKYKGWILSGLGLALVIAAGFMLRTRPKHGAVAAAPNATSPASPKTDVTARPAALHGTASGPVSKTALLAALKEELFALETERLEGKLTDAEYTELKSAFEVVLRRALARETVPAGR